jgi:quercetin dioxygenase-like cupin family protein
VKVVKTLFCATTNATGQPIEYPSGGTPEVTAFLAELAPGEVTTWHQHPVPLLGYVLSGELTVVQADGEKRVVRTGEVSLESVGRVHQGRNTGPEPLKMIVFVIGLKDVPFITEEKS